jgi:putative addiction module component (TIGR02574 family)
MSKAEILEELPKLKPRELQEILERIWELEEANLVTETGPSEREKALLDHELEDYRVNPDAGSSWEGVAARLGQAPKREMARHHSSPRRGRPEGG